MKKLLIALVLVPSLLLVGGLVWLAQPVTERSAELTVGQGMSLRSVITRAREKGLKLPLWPSLALLRWHGAPKVRPGVYTIAAKANTWDVVQVLLNAQPKLVAVRLLEGASFADLARALANAENLKTEPIRLQPDSVRRALGLNPNAPLEGQFFPDTYLVAPGTSATSLLRSAHDAMQSRLSQAWAARSANAAVQSPQEALILASIIDKETGRDSDRSLVSAVFNNRLRIGMRLQTDPTVIYGLGQNFDGNLRKIHLQTDGPYNTYTRAGLPPTPIALPSSASLTAALQPADSNALYFVAKGDGNTQFSATLAEHNRAVDRFQRGQ